jgi:hypothetical protein
MFEIPQLHITYRRGDSRGIVFTLTTGGNAVDLTSWTAPALAVHSTPAPTDTTTQVMHLTGAISGTPTDGQVTFTPTTTESDLAPGAYYYDAQIVDNGGATITFVEGQFVVTQDLTKD